MKPLVARPQVLVLGIFLLTGLVLGCQPAGKEPAKPAPSQTADQKQTQAAPDKSAGLSEPANPFGDTPAAKPQPEKPPEGQEAGLSLPGKAAPTPSEAASEEFVGGRGKAETLKPQTPAASPADELPGATKDERAEAAKKPDDAGGAAADKPADPRKPPDLGPPLVEKVAELKRLDKVFPVWLDPVNKQVVLMGQVCQRQAVLEMFACLRETKEHESVVVVDAKAYVVHAALLAAGAKVGNPVQFSPKYVPASGTEVEVTVVWKDAKGEIQRARGQDWVRNVKTNQALEHPWVFAGSGFWADDDGRLQYKAEGGDFICVSNFPSAMLDLPIESSQTNAELLFQAFTERIPPLGTPLTLLLKPKQPASK